MKQLQCASLFRLSLRVVYGRWRHKRLLFLLMTVCIAAVLFPTAVFLLFQSVSFASAQETYGIYDFLVTDLSQMETGQIKAEQDVAQSALMYMESYRDPIHQFDASVVYGDESLFSGLLSYCLAEGRMPRTSTEVLCDTAFSQAYPDAIQNQQVQIGGAYYEIVGTFYLKEETNHSTVYQPAFFLLFSACPAEAFPISLLMESHTESQKEICRQAKQLQDQYLLDDTQISLNTLALDTAFMAGDGGIAQPYNRILQTAVGVFASLAAALLLFLLRLSVKPIQQDAAVYAAVGISVATLWQGLMLCTVCMLSGGLIVSALAMVSLFAVYLFANDLPVGVHIIHSLPALWYAAGFTIMVTMAAAIVFWLIPQRRIAVALKNAASVRIGKSRQQAYSCLDDVKLPWLALAKQTRSVHPCLHCLSVTVLVIAFGMFSMGIYLTGFLHLSVPTVRYDYQITYQYRNWMSALTGSKSIAASYQRLLCQDGLEIYSYYVTSYPVQLYTHQISEEYRSFRSEQSTEYAEIFRSGANRLYSDDFLIIGATAQDLQKLYGITCDGIPSGTCIAVENTMPIQQQEIPVDMPIGTQLYVQCNYGMNADSLTLTVTETAESIAYQDNTFANLPMIVINEKDFRQLVPIDYPQQLFVNTEDSALLQQIVREDAELRLVDLSEKRQETKRIKWSVILFSCQLFVMLLLVIAISCFLMLQHHTERSKGQYAMLKAIGFQDQTICFMSIYDLLHLWRQGIVFGSMFAAAGCFILWLVIHQDNSVYIPFDFSLREWILPAVALTLAMAAAAVPILQTVRKLPVPETLNREQT